MESNIISATFNGIPPGFGCRSRTSFLGNTCMCTSLFVSPEDVTTSTRMKSASTVAFPVKTPGRTSKLSFNFFPFRHLVKYLYITSSRSKEGEALHWKKFCSCSILRHRAKHKLSGEIFYGSFGLLDLHETVSNGLESPLFLTGCNGITNLLRNEKKKKHFSKKFQERVKFFCCGRQGEAYFSKNRR